MFYLYSELITQAITWLYILGSSATIVMITTVIRYVITVTVIGWGGPVLELGRNTPLEDHRSYMEGKTGSLGGVQFCFCFFYVFTFLWVFVFSPSLVLLRVAGSWRQGFWGGMDLSQHFNFTFWSVNRNIGCFYSASCITMPASIGHYE